MVVKSRLLEDGIRQLLPSIGTGTHSLKLHYWLSMHKCPHLKFHASSPQTPLSTFMLSTGRCTNCPFLIFMPHFMEPSFIRIASDVGISSSFVATRIEECTGGITRMLSRMTLFKYGNSSSAVCSSFHLSESPGAGKLDEAGSSASAAENPCSSVRSFFWMEGYEARARSVQVSASEVVSEPAKRKVLTL